MLASENDSLGPGPDAQLVIDVRYMIADCFFTDKQRAPDLGISMPLDQLNPDSALAL